MHTIRRAVLVSATVAALSLPAVNAASAEPVSNGVTYAAAPASIAGTSPDGLGTWSVHYQRIDGGQPNIAAAINDDLDAEAEAQVWQNTWDASTTHRWTFESTGTLSFRPLTISALFVGEYDTDLPNMPFHTVATRVFDSRRGVLITWNNLFRDKQAGLTRLSEQTTAILPTIYTLPPSWRSGGETNPLDINFKYWIPTAEGIELHFPDHQFGRGLPVITVPWAKVADLIAPEFLPITE
ncbi:MAG: DUF3298 domain-containing protein [Mycobacterium sp.]